MIPISTKVYYKEKNLICTVVDANQYEGRMGYVIESDIPNFEGELWKLFDCYEEDIKVLSKIDYIDGIDIKVKYIGNETLAFEYDKVYQVISIESGWFRIMTELDEDYLFPIGNFKIVPI